MTELDLGPIRERLAGKVEAVIEDFEVDCDLLCNEVESLRTQLKEAQAECDRRAVLIAFLHAGNPPTLDEIAIGFGLLPTPGVRRKLVDDICTISRQGLAAIRRAKGAGDEQ